MLRQVSHFNVAGLKEQLLELHETMNEPDFWNDLKRSTEVSRKVRLTENKVEHYQKLCQRADDVDATMELAEEMQDTDLLAEMAKHFPDEVTPAGIDRRALARKVFTDAAARRTLNEITHPAVVRAMALQLRQQEESGTPFVVLDVPLLFESGADRLCTVTCAVLSDVSHSIERICARDNISESHALARLQSQSDDPYYLQRCDFTLRNDGEKDDFIAQCREFLRKTARI